MKSVRHVTPRAGCSPVYRASTTKKKQNSDGPISDAFGEVPMLTNKWKDSKQKIVLWKSFHYGELLSKYIAFLSPLKFLLQIAQACAPYKPVSDHFFVAKVVPCEGANRKKSFNL